MAAPALTPTEIMNMYKAGAMNGVNGSIAAKRLVHTTRAGSMRNLPGSYNSMLQAGVRVSPVAPTTRTTRNTTGQDNKATPVVAATSAFGLDELGQAAHAFPSVLPEGTVDPAVANTPTGMPVGFVPGGDLDGPTSPNIGLRVDTAKADPDPKTKPDHEHDAGMQARFSQLTPLEKKLVQGGMDIARAIAIQQAIDNGPDGTWRHRPDGDTAKAIFAAAQKNPTATPDDVVNEAKKRMQGQQGTMVAQGAPVPNALPRPKGPDHIG